LEYFQEQGVVDVEFSEGPLGIHLVDRKGKYGASIRNFISQNVSEKKNERMLDNREESGGIMAAEASGLLEIGMVVLRVGEKEAIGEEFQTVLSMLRNVSFFFFLDRFYTFYLRLSFFNIG
jgi:hypothetical protein